MTTDCVTFDLAYVDAPDFEAVKVEVAMTPDHLIVQDLRGRMLLETDGMRWVDPESNGRRYIFNTTESPETEIIIQKVDGCKCGGTSLTERRRITV